MLWEYAITTNNANLLRIIPIYSPCACRIPKGKPRAFRIGWVNGDSDDSWLHWQHSCGRHRLPTPMLHEYDGDSDAPYMGDAYQIATVKGQRRLWA